MIVANLLAVASALGLEVRVVAGFVDSKVNELLGLEDDREATVAPIPMEDGSKETGGATTIPH